MSRGTFAILHSHETPGKSSEGGVEIPQERHRTIISRRAKSQLGDPNGTSHYLKDPPMPQPTSPLEREFLYAVSPRNGEAYPADRVQPERGKEEDAHFKMERGGSIFKCKKKEGAE